MTSSLALVNLNNQIKSLFGISYMNIGRRQKRVYLKKYINFRPDWLPTRPGKKGRYSTCVLRGTETFLLQWRIQQNFKLSYKIDRDFASSRFVLWHNVNVIQVEQYLGEADTPSFNIFIEVKKHSLFFCLQITIQIKKTSLKCFKQ